MGAALLIVLGASGPASAQQCAPLDDGHIADAFYEGTAILWDPVVEFQRITLTISGPCEDIVKVFTSKDQVMFDIREIERITDGEYTWTLRREASIDPTVQADLTAARGSGEEDQLWWSYFQAGKIPAGPYSETGAFSVVRGEIVEPVTGGEEEKVATRTKGGLRSSDLVGSAAVGGFADEESPAGGSGAPNSLASKAQIISPDGVVYNSICVGFDCPTNPSFGADTIRMQENNLRIHFDDTSTAASYPNQDWRIEANSNLNGGAEYLRFIDATANRNIMTLEANAPSNSLVVDSGGRVGMGTANPVVEVHTANGDTPTLRLDQTTASGFAAQVWDVAGNETSFFVRDATNGSTLPFRIRPGASSNALVIDTDSDVGVGILSPEQELHVFGTDGGTQLLVEEASGTAATRTLLRLENNGGVRLALNDMNITAAGGNISLNPNTGVNVNGDLTVTGVKNFAVVDPEDASRALYYAALEGPEAGTYFRGQAKTVDGRVEIELPKVFSKVTEASGMTVQLTPIGGWGQLYIEEYSPEKLVVRLAGDEAADLEFHYFVQGVRKGYLDYEVERSSDMLP